MAKVRERTARKTTVSPTAKETAETAAVQLVLLVVVAAVAVAVDLTVSALVMLNSLLVVLRLLWCFDYRFSVLTRRPVWPCLVNTAQGSE